ncbi:recombinase family protein [Actinoplanes auranticolor]|uniref:recombinase family protein n=2 Tax=Actinoplanes auranticolor TaxID=47988 RepID=UPI0031F0F2D6
MNLKEWAAVTGISYAPARRRFESGTLPVPAYRLGRLIMVGEPLTGAVRPAEQVVVYARGSSADQKPDLDRQVARVVVWATGRGVAVDRVVTEVGSALDGQRKKFVVLLRGLAVTTRAVEHRNRCARRYGRRGAADRARRGVEAAIKGPA